MPRAATTTDVFNAIAEPRRRQIVAALAGGMRRGGAPADPSELLAGPGVTVGELVEELGLAQPAVSKHLGVLRKVGVVTVRKRGRHRLYELNAKALKPVHDWVRTFEKYWEHQLDRIKQRAERMAGEGGNRASTGETPVPPVGNQAFGHQEVSNGGESDG